MTRNLMSWGFQAVVMLPMLGWGLQFSHENCLCPGAEIVLTYMLDTAINVRLAFAVLPSFLAV